MKPPVFSKYFDHTILQPAATIDDLKNVCQEAVDIHAASVCIHPARVAEVHSLLEGSDVLTGAAIGFPSGAHTIEIKAAEAIQAIADGADEFDYVINIGKAKEHDWNYIAREMLTMKEAAKEGNARFKVIFENCYLEPEEMIELSRIARDIKPDFIKTSTGFGPSGAKAEDVALMKQHAGDKVAVKAAGGIRTLKECLAMIEAGADRIGCSRSAEILKEYERENG